MLGVDVRQLREPEATLVEEDEWIEPFIGQASRGQGLENLEAHHRADVGLLHQNGLSRRSINWWSHLPHLPFHSGSGDDPSSPGGGVALSASQCLVTMILLVLFL